MNNSKSTKPVLALAAALSLASTNLGAQSIEEIIVTADFYDSSALQMPASVTVLDAETIQNRHAENLEDLFGLAPNVNYASGASRGRFIQIRGIGERSEFIEPVNYSVGVLIDGIDFTGISTAATTLDIDQVEVLRGPQGTLYGANALAGLINLVSAGPTEQTEGHAEVTLGNYDTRTLKGALGGAISENLGYRVAAQSTNSDGYYTNSYLDRDDTNNIDETTLRGKLAFAASDSLDLGLTYLYADVDNGYDVFNYNSDRDTIANEPGHDRQKTAAFALTADWQISDELAFEGLVSSADSDIEYGYDEDWRNPELCIVETCVFGPDGYHTAFDNYERDNQNDSVDLRVVSSSADSGTNWVLGIYYRDQSVDLTRTYSYDGFDSVFASTYDTTNTAFYGDWSKSLSDNLSISAGARFEERDADYADSDAFGFSTNESLWGGKISLAYDLADNQHTYLTISRGYKPGGANSNSAVPEEFREYDTETMINYEVGYKGVFLDSALQTLVSVFYQDRKDIQTDSAIVECPGSGQPCSFDDYLTNAASGKNYGLEAELSYFLDGQSRLYASIGLLDATYDSDYVNYQHVTANPDAEDEADAGFSMDGRDQPHAPSYQFVVGAQIVLNEQLTLDLNLEASDDFLFSNDHDVRSSAYRLLNADLSYEHDNWRASLWGKNLTDEDYENRAFGTFPNDPLDGYSTFGPYSQLNAPRTFGVTARYSF